MSLILRLDLFWRHAIGEERPKFILTNLAASPNFPNQLDMAVPHRVVHAGGK